MTRLVLAFILDLILADPHAWPHPVKAMGAYITWFTGRLKARFSQRTPSKQVQLGLALVVSLLLLIFALTRVSLVLLGRFHPLVREIFSVYLIYTCFSVKGLADAGQHVKEALDQSLGAGRQALSHYVGRETHSLTESQILTAVIETISENLSDGFVAPLVYIFLAGPVGGLLYKGINTLDSMVGYRHPPYTHYGHLAAKLDDLVNWLPARITGLLICLASWLLGLDGLGAWQTLKSDHSKHLSPNSGWPEAAMAGALGIQMGGGSYYQGTFVAKDFIGQAKKPVTRTSLDQSIQLLYLTALLALVSLGLARYLLGGIL